MGLEGTFSPRNPKPDDYYYGSVVVLTYDPHTSIGFSSFVCLFVC